MEEDRKIIAKSAKDIIENRPAYRSIAEFYSKVFSACKEEESRIKSLEIPVEDAGKRLEHGFPLIDPSDFPIEKDRACDLLEQILRIALSSEKELQNAAKQLLKQMETEKLKLRSILSPLPDPKTVEALARQTEVPSELIALFAYLSILPWISAGARFLARYIDGWDKGICPVCGAPPAMSFINGEGHRFGVCSFCGNEWGLKRLFCPFCEREDPSGMNYLYIEEEEEYRIDICKSCKSYLKSIDIRNTSRTIYMPLEIMCSIHLDILAERAG